MNDLSPQRLTFTPSDVGSIVKLHNSRQAKIISVIREYGEIYVVCGIDTDNKDVVYFWDVFGQSEIHQETIVEIL